MSIRFKEIPKYLYYTNNKIQFQFQIEVDKVIADQAESFNIILTPSNEPTSTYILTFEKELWQLESQGISTYTYSLNAARKVTSVSNKVIDKIHLIKIAAISSGRQLAITAPGRLLTCINGIYCSSWKYNHSGASITFAFPIGSGSSNNSWSKLELFVDSQKVYSMENFDQNNIGPTLTIPIPPQYAFGQNGSHTMVFNGLTSKGQIVHISGSFETSNYPALSSNDKLDFAEDYKLKATSISDIGVVKIEWPKLVKRTPSLIAKLFSTRNSSEQTIPNSVELLFFGMGGIEHPNTDYYWYNDQNFQIFYQNKPVNLRVKDGWGQNYRTFSSDFDKQCLCLGLQYSTYEDPSEKWKPFIENLQDCEFYFRPASPALIVRHDIVSDDIKYLIQETKMSNTVLDYGCVSGHTYRYELYLITAPYIYDENNSSALASPQLCRKVLVDSITITPIFEQSMELKDKNRTFYVKFNPDMSSFKTVIQEKKIETIGDKYPRFTRNGNIGYKEMPISGLISHQLEEDSETNIRPSTPSEYVVNDDIYQIEQQYKRELEEWLNNGEPKVLRTPTEGSFIVRLGNVSLTPEKTLGRLLHSFSATAYEIMEYSQENLIELGLMTEKLTWIGTNTTEVLGESSIFSYAKVDEPSEFDFECLEYVAHSGRNYPEPLRRIELSLFQHEKHPQLNHFDSMIWKVLDESNNEQEIILDLAELDNGNISWDFTDTNHEYKPLKNNYGCIRTTLNYTFQPISDTEVTNNDETL